MQWIAIMHIHLHMTTSYILPPLGMRSGESYRCLKRQCGAHIPESPLQQLLVAPKAHTVPDALCPSGAAAGALPRTCLNSIRVISRSVVLQPVCSTAPKVEIVPGALCSPFSGSFYNCCCCRVFLFPSAQRAQLCT